jgi:hypothetical protein
VWMRVLSATTMLIKSEASSEWDDIGTPKALSYTKYTKAEGEISTEQYETEQNEPTGLNELTGLGEEGADTNRSPCSSANVPLNSMTGKRMNCNLCKELHWR